MTRARIGLLLSLWALAAAGACRRAPARAPSAATNRPPAASGDVPPHLPRANHGTGAIEGEQPEFDRGLQPDRILAALALRPGQHVADLGAGRGYFVPRLAAAVGPRGAVVATDVDDTALETLRLRFAHTPNVEVRAAAPDDPGLEAGRYDLVLMSEMDHFLDDRVAYLKRVRSALTPDGVVAVTHFTGMREPLMAAAGAAGYRVVRELQTPQHYLVLLQPIVSN